MTPEVQIRGPRPSDRPAMLAITRTVWDGDDYVPAMWDTWLRHPSGTVQVATVSEQVVGFQHVEVQPDGTAWLEGIRVKEEVRGQGVGRALLRAGIHWAEQAGSPAVRLATSSDNLASNRLCERAGLRLIDSFTSISRHATTQQESSVRPGLPTDVDALMPFLSACPRTAFYTEGWHAYRLSKERLRFLLALGCVAVAGTDPVEAVGIVTTNVTRPSFRLGLLCGNDDGMRAILRHMLGVAARSGYGQVRGPIALNDRSAEALLTSGFEIRNDHAMLLHGIDCNQVS